MPFYLAEKNTAHIIRRYAGCLHVYACCLMIMMFSCVSNAEQHPAAPQETQHLDSQQQQIQNTKHSDHNKIVINGIQKDTLKHYIDQTVITKYQRKKTPYLAADIRHDLQKALKAKGYYSANISGDPSSPWVFNVKPGTIYRIAQINLLGFDKIKAPLLNIGDPLDADQVLQAQQNLLSAITQQACLYNASIKNNVYLDTTQYTAQIDFVISGENNAKFGTSQFEGAQSINRDYLKTFVNYQEGACWSLLAIERTKAALIKTGLITSVNAILPKHLPADHNVPIRYILKEAPKRKIKLGAHYSNTDGPGVSATWQHNNLFGSGEQGSIETKLTSLEQSISMLYQQPQFLSTQQQLKTEINIRQQQTDAFEATTLDLNINALRKLSDHWSLQVGASLETSRVIDRDNIKKSFSLASTPVSLNFDNRDNILDPKQGHTLFLVTEPFVDILGEAKPFLKSRITGTSYLQLGATKEELVLAFRGSIGSILGSDTQEIPASKRFYAGGGGSVRGFSYQKAGPVNENDDPEGGRSLLEASTGMRIKFNDTLGAAIFVDGGNVYNHAYPDLKEDLYIGAGAGIRYYTGFGPIRLDIATPVNNRNQHTQNIQIYISIGQAY